MLLIDQVHLLRQNIARLGSFKVCLPLLGGVESVRQAYDFVNLVHPARDIITSIRKADPAGDRLPNHLRGWNLKAQDRFGKDTTVDLKFLLGMLVHVYYLSLDGEILDVSNDSGKRVIVAYPEFMKAVSRLVLSPVDVALTTCHLARNVHVGELDSLCKSNRQHQTLHMQPDSIPGPGDFAKLLWEIRAWPELMEAMWRHFFQPASTALEADANVVQNRPYSKGRRLEPNGDYKWSIGWRRGPVISKIDVDPLALIEFMRIRFEAMVI